MKNKIVKNNLLIIHGPNLNLLGGCDVEIHGKESFSLINRQLTVFAKTNGFECKIFHSNHEGDIVDVLQQAKDEVDVIIINAGAYSHYSIAIRDAIEAVCLPCVEVHCNNIFKRESFRNTSIISTVCVGSVVGFGKYSYFLAIEAAKNLI